MLLKRAFFQDFVRAGTLAALLGLVPIHAIHAQVLYGSLIGTVTDPSGSVVPNTTVTLSAKDTGQ